MSSDRPFAELLERLRRGDDEAARLVFERYARRLIGLAAVRLPVALRPKVDAESVVQSVFLSLFTRLADGRFELASWDNLWTLLTVFTVRKCGHRLERFHAGIRDVRREVSTTADPDDTRSDLEPASPEPTAEEEVLLNEALEGVLSGLKEEQRPIVLLRLQGYTIEEISDRLGWSERTVHRVLDRVREHLEASAVEEGT